jgi:hypothetical protein
MLYRGLTDTDPTAYRGPARRHADRAQRHPAGPRGASMTPQAARQEADLHGGTTRRTIQSALFRLLLFAARQAIEDDLPRARRVVSQGAGAHRRGDPPVYEQRRRARPDHRLIGYTFMTLSTGVPVDSEDLHRFVRRQFAIYSVQGHASAGSNPTPTRGH